MLQQHDFVIYDYTSKMSLYSHHTFYEDDTERSFRLLMHFNNVSVICFFFVCSCTSERHPYVISDSSP